MNKLTKEQMCHLIAALQYFCDCMEYGEMDSSAGWHWGKAKEILETLTKEKSS